MAYLSWSLEDQVAVILLQRPPANALSQGLLRELSGVMDELAVNDQVKVVLVHGDGRFFSAGADIKEFTDIEKKEGCFKLSKVGQDLFERMENFPKPIIAAIHGAALGGGLELAMACHIRLVSENAKLGLPELSLGLVPGFGGTQRLPKFVGTAKAAEMLFTSEPITGVEAVQFGLANQAYPENEVFDQALTMAKKNCPKKSNYLKSCDRIIELLENKQIL